MIDKNIHLTNSNTLSHDWDPSSTEETLTLDQNGIINVVPNAKRYASWPIELQTAVVILKELRIFVNHCQSASIFAEEFKTGMADFPSTNITQYHEKISVYQGAINLLSQHVAFLKKVPQILKQKLQEEGNVSFLNSELLNTFENVEKTNNDHLKRLDYTLKNLRETQRLCAMNVERHRGHIVGHNTMPLPQIDLYIFQPILFEIGHYSYQDQNYTINVGIELDSLNSLNDWERYLTKNPLGNFTFKILNSDSNSLVSNVTATTTWTQREYPVLSGNNTDKIESTTWGVHYPSLFAEGEHLIPCVNPTLFIKEERFNVELLQPIHMNKLYQTLAEWMQFYNFDKIVVYDIEENASARYEYGFSTETSAHLAALPVEHLNNRVEDNVRERPVRLPFTLRNNQLHAMKQHDAEPQRAVSYAELIAKKPLLDKKCMPNVHPSMSGVSFLPYSNMLEMLRSRETTQVAKKNPVGIKAVRVDFCDLMRPAELMACAQVGSEDLKLAKIKLNEGEVLKVKRFAN